MVRSPRIGPGVFSNATEPRCDLPGRYWTDVRVVTSDAEGRSLEVFRDRWSGFTVVGDVPAKAASSLPVVGSSRSLLWPVVSATTGLLLLAAILQRRKTR
jgi:hypothetical protein